MRKIATAMENKSLNNYTSNINHREVERSKKVRVKSGIVYNNKNIFNNKHSGKYINNEIRETFSKNGS